MCAKGHGLHRETIRIIPSIIGMERRISHLRTSPRACIIRDDFCPDLLLSRGSTLPTPLWQGSNGWMRTLLQSLRAGAMTAIQQSSLFFFICCIHSDTCKIRMWKRASRLHHPQQCAQRTTAAARPAGLVDTVGQM